MGSSSAMLQASLEAGPPIDGSESWWSSCESNDNMLRCGDKCCCQTGYVYEAKIEACTQPEDQGMIPGSDSWWSCSHPNMHTCGNLCCCNAETEYDAEVGFCDAVRRLSSAWMLNNNNSKSTDNETTSVMLQVSMEAGPPIDGSESWWSSCESYDNMLRCGDKCCCQTGYVYEAKIEACTQPEDQGMIPGSDSWWSCDHPNMHTCGNLCCCDAETNYKPNAGFCDVRKLSSAQMINNDSSNGTNSARLQASMEAGPPIDGS